MLLHPRAHARGQAKRVQGTEDKSEELRVPEAEQGNYDQNAIVTSYFIPLIISTVQDTIKRGDHQNQFISLI